MLNIFAEIDWPGLRNPMLVVLALWVAFFLAIDLTITTLNRVIVPVLELPLGVFLAAQGALAVFAALLWLLARKRA